MITRLATTSDAGTISEFVSKVVTDHVAPTLGDGGLDTLLASMSVSATENRLANGWPHICGFEDDKLAGIIVIQPPTHLYHLFVRTDLQRVGLGRGLLAIADDWSMSENGVPMATVNSSLNAQAAYVRFGFEPKGPVVDNHGVRYQPMIRADSQ